MSSVRRVRASALGGQSNELGGAYRAGVAAYLAAHALASQPARHIGLEESSGPLVIKVESDEAVDDLLCQAPVGALLLQAKRTCGMDARFRSAVDQWVAVVQEKGLEAHSRLVLVTGMATGPLRDLGAALERRRNPDAQQPSAGEQVALNRLISIVDGRLDDVQLRALLDAAMVVEIAAESPEAAAFREAARLLEGTVVPAGQGIAAMEALQHHFQTLGARRWASDRQVWRQALRDANLQLLADPQGGWSARRSAIERELDAYRSYLSERQDEFPLNLLSLDLPPMRVKDLASTFQVALPGDLARGKSLGNLCRRWGRVAVVGLLGSGKSTSLEQIAATWASRDDAPVPIVVRLPSLLRQVEDVGGAISLTTLVDHAVRLADRDVSILVPELVRLCEIGQAALLFDGLDECRAKAAWAADAIMKIIEALPEATSVILTTRRSALPAASKLGLPEVELLEPYRLEQTLHDLIEHIARHRVGEPDRRAWIRDRSQRLEDVRGETSQLLSVPLMAVLLTLLVAERGSLGLGVGRAELLSQIVRDCVKRWESQKPELGREGGDLDSGMLLDAFSEIGHALSQSPNLKRESAKRAVATQFDEAWGLAPRAASEAAEEAVSFWDDRVGVFVSLPPEQSIEPRSRVFVEIAEAMWIERQAEPVVRKWVRAALAHQDSRDTLILAGGLAPTVVEILVEEAARTDGAESIALAADALMASKAVALSTQQSLLDLIEASLANVDHQGVHSAERSSDSALEGVVGEVAARQGRRDGPVWPMARRLAQLPLDESLWVRRDRILDRLETQEERVLVRALSAVTQVAARGGGPSEEEIQHMASLLHAPIPEAETKSRRVSRRHVVFIGPSWSPLSGFGDALVGCIQWLPEIDEDVARIAWRAAQHTGFGHAVRVERLLVQRGHGAVMAETIREQIGAVATRFAGNPWDAMRPYYELVAMAAPPRNLTLAQAWRLENLSNLSELLGLSGLGLDDLRQAFSRARADMEFLVPLYATRAGLNLGGLAAEARIAAEAHDRGSDGEIVHALFVPPPPGNEVSLASTPIEEDARVRLMEILRCGVELPFVLALRLLYSEAGRGVSEDVFGMLDEIPPWHRSRAARLAVLLAEDQADAVIRLVSDEDGVVRVAAAGMLAEMVVAGEDDARLQQALEEAVGAPDYATRAAIFAEFAGRSSDGEINRLVEFAQVDPKCWTCRDCGREQAVGDFDCRDCRTGSRPDLPAEVCRRFAWYVDPL